MSTCASLVALPLLLVAEIVIHLRMQPVVRQFLDRELVTGKVIAQFEAARGRRAHRLRNSVLAEVLMLAAVYGIGVLVVWRGHTAVNVASWYGLDVGGRLQPSLAGWWFGCVSLPLFQFMLRWYFRLCVWVRFLWQVSKRIETAADSSGQLRRVGLSFRSGHGFRAVAAGAGCALCRGRWPTRFFSPGRSSRSSRWRSSAWWPWRCSRSWGR